MSTPATRREFFALEAGEYLERLVLLVAGSGPPDAESLVRSARALRGSALMAGPPGYAVAAAAIEQVAKALREGSALWSPTLAERLREAVETGQLLLRRLREWSEQDIARCERTAEELSALLGSPARRSRLDESPAAPTQSAAVRAYIARETAVLAATLEHAATAVEGADASGPSGFSAVSGRLQPLRGLGALPGLAPLPELLEALDLTLAHGRRSGAWPPAAGRAFGATSLALARLARDIAELGLPQPDAPEIVAAAEQLREAFANEQDVVPIASLIAAGDTEPIVHRGTPPAPEPPPQDLTLELIALADRLRDAAVQLRTGPSGPARALQLHSLVFSLRGLTLSPAVAGTAGNLLCRLDRETMAGRALPAAERLAGLLDRAAGALADTAETGAIARLGAVLAPLCEELDRGVGIVPIESLAPEPESAVVPIESLGYDVTPAHNSFEQTFATYYRLMHAAAPAAEEQAVPIQSLVYRGKRALQRADRVRRELDAALRAQKQLPDIRLLLGELLDLVPLALDDDR